MARNRMYTPSPRGQLHPVLLVVAWACCLSTILLALPKREISRLSKPPHSQPGPGWYSKNQQEQPKKAPPRFLAEFLQAKKTWKKKAIASSQHHSEAWKGHRKAGKAVAGQTHWQLWPETKPSNSSARAARSRQADTNILGGQM